MHENLTSLVRELRNETCPPRVFEEVKLRTATPRPSRMRFAIAGLAAALALLCCFGAWRWHGAHTGPTRKQSPVAIASDRAEIARQTVAALEFVGAALADAGERSEKAILNQAVPPLRNSLERASKKTINRLKL